VTVSNRCISHFCSLIIFVSPEIEKLFVDMIAEHNEEAEKQEQGKP